MRAPNRAIIFILSLALHALIFLSLPTFHPAPKSAAVVELVEVSAPQPPQLPRPQQARSLSRSKTHKTEAAPSERELTQARGSENYNFSPNFRPRGDLDLKPQFTVDGDRVDDPNSDWGSGSGEFSRIKDLGKFDRLYDVIDSHVVYPSVLAYHQISGTVNARLILSAKTGKCDWHATTIESTEAHLKVYVLDVLKKVCTRDLSRFARKSFNANLDLSFKFAITEHDDKLLKESERKVVGNVFLFYRNSQASIAEWHLGPFRGMFPLPTVSIDFVWLKENYDRVMHSRDPLKEFKSHLTDEPPS